MAAPGPLAKTRPLAPAIPRPKLDERQSFAGQFLEKRAFSIPYYLEKTDNWRHTKLVPILRIVKVCAGEALKKNQKNIHGFIGGLAAQGDGVIEQTYGIFLDELAKTKERLEMEDEYYGLILDLLASTENFDSSRRADKLWLYFWCTAETARAIKKAAGRRAQKESSLEAPSSLGTLGEPSASSIQHLVVPPQPRERGIGIRDLICEDLNI